MKKTGLKKKLNIVSLDIPYPPDYGGAIDIFQRLSSLKKMKVKINLHCYYYNRNPATELEKLCFKTYYYKRDMNYFNMFSSVPFMIKSRSSSKLLKNLNKNSYPILFEGLHTCNVIENPQLKERKKIIRMHNVEYKYYDGLSNFTNDPLKKLYYKIESRKLNKFEKLIYHSDLLCTISDNDYEYYSALHNNVMNLPAFHTHHIYQSEEQENYALYHGNLNISENEYTALYLINQIFNKLNYPLIIAGRNPTKKLKRIITSNPRVHLFENIQTEELNNLIAKARIHILPAFQSAGIKLKLIHVLNSKGHIITNSKMLTDKKLAEFCNIADSNSEMKKLIKNKAKQCVEEKMIKKRQNFLLENYSNERNAEILIDRIFNHPISNSPE